MLPINRRISPYNHYNNNNIQYIVLHYVGATGTAKNNADYFYGGDRSASAHYFVDDTSIWQSVEDYHGAWHVGDGNGRYGISNTNSIGVEMCCQNDGKLTISSETEANALELVKYLMSKYNIDINHVVRHYDASRKICPNWNANNWSRWWNFKKKLTSNIIISKPSQGSKLYRVRRWWSDPSSQVGAYRNLQSAIEKCNEYTEYSVFDSNGKTVYTNKKPVSSYSSNVKTWQHAMNVGFDLYHTALVEDGIWGPKCEDIASTYPMSYGIVGCPTAVKWLQNKLGISADGIFGSGTRTAVINFQKNHGLSVDGIVGLNTYKKLLGI